MSEHDLASGLAAVNAHGGPITRCGAMDSLLDRVYGKATTQTEMLPRTTTSTTSHFCFGSEAIGA